MASRVVDVRNGGLPIEAEHQVAIQDDLAGGLGRGPGQSPATCVGCSDDGAFPRPTSSAGSGLAVALGTPAPVSSLGVGIGLSLIDYPMPFPVGPGGPVVEDPPERPPGPKDDPLLPWPWVNDREPVGKDDEQESKNEIEETFTEGTTTIQCTRIETTLGEWKIEAEDLDVSIQTEICTSRDGKSQEYRVCRVYKGWQLLQYITHVFIRYEGDKRCPPSSTDIIEGPIVKAEFEHMACGPWRKARGPKIEWPDLPRDIENDADHAEWLEQRKALHRDSRSVTQTAVWVKEACEDLR